MGEARRRARDYTQTINGYGRDERLRSMSRASDFMPTKPQAKAESAEELLHGSEEKQRIRQQRRNVRRQMLRPRTLTIVACSLVVLGAGVTGWLLFAGGPAANANPFTPAILASAKFPLYYPTQLPDGYRIDPSSVTEPEANVVVVTLRGPHGEKLYMSEEPRSKTFDLGGFYQSLSNLKEVAVSDGAVAVGFDNKTRNEVVSRANNQTWILCNTTAHVPQSQLVAMLKSLTNSY